MNLPIAIIIVMNLVFSLFQNCLSKSTRTIKKIAKAIFAQSYELNKKTNEKNYYFHYFN